MLQGDIIKMGIKKELRARNEIKEQIRSLDANYEKVSDAVHEIGGKLAGLIVKTDAVLKTGKSTAKIDEQLTTMKSSKSLLEERLLRLKSADGKTGLIPETRRELDNAEKVLQVAMVEVLQAEKNETADKMSDFFKTAMDIFDQYNSDAEALCASLGVNIYIGGKDLSPLADEPRLWQLLENGFLKSPVPVISVPTDPSPVEKTKTEVVPTGKPSQSALAGWEKNRIASERVTKQTSAVNSCPGPKQEPTDGRRFGG